MTKDLLVFDFETTGLDYNKCEIIEMGLLYFKNINGKYQEYKRYDILIKQNEPLTEEIKNLTHITDELLESDGITKSEACQIFMENYSKDMILCGYNVHFDLLFLKSFINYFNKDFVITNDVLDVMAMYKDFYPYRHKLEDAIKLLNVEGINSHRAIDDVAATYNLLVAICYDVRTKYNIANFTPDAYINKIGVNPKYPYSEENKFKHLKYIFQQTSGKGQEIWRYYIQNK